MLTSCQLNLRSLNLCQPNLHEQNLHLSRGACLSWPQLARAPDWDGTCPKPSSK